MAQGSHLVRTIRVRNDNRAGVLARVLAVISEEGGNCGDIRLIAVGPTHMIRDIDIELGSAGQLDRILERLRGMESSTVLEVRDEVLSAHIGGKLKIISKVEVHTAYDLGRIYTPGVGEVVRRVHQEPAAALRYTTIGNTVAVISDGSAILGLGNLGPVAAMPVLEGKAALLAQLVHVNAVPIVLNVHEVPAMVETIANISLGFGAIQLEDIGSPHCFELEPALQERVSVAVFHDDQHGTAAVVLAALINGCKILQHNLKKLRVGQIGLGAGGLGIARTMMHYTGNPVHGCDIVAAAVQRLVEAGGEAASLEEVMATADVVIAATGKPGLISPSQLRRGQLIFALSNPWPEIEPEQALAAGAALAASGKAINNLLCYPGMCRGLLDSYATRATPELFRAASQTLVEATPSGQLLPDALDRGAHARVAQAVASKAEECGLARRHPDAELVFEE
ncbi:MAG: NAD-dependent malic enzyme [Dehalococcoidia bacterium]